MMETRTLCAIYCIHDDDTFLAPSIRSVGDLPKIVFVSRLNWRGEAKNWERVVEAAQKLGAEVEIGDWPDESSHRRHALQAARARGFQYALTVDSDEIIEPELLEHLGVVAANGFADRIYIEWNTYWKDAEHVIRPREPFTPCIMVNLETVRHVSARDYEGGRPLFLGEAYGIVHHLSYAGGDERIWNKITTWSHRDEIVPRWWEKVWKGWDGNMLLRDIHPTHPRNYGFAERIPLPEALSRVGIGPLVRPTNNNSVRACSVVIPAYGEQEALDACLASLEKCGGLVSEIVVVDDFSPKKIRAKKGVRVIRHSANCGFAAACNTGLAATSGESVLFLNSDTVVPQIGLIRLLNSLWQSGSVAAAGPYSNNVGHLQQVQATYTDRCRLDLFAQDFSVRGDEDRDVDMLVGFCLAAKRSALNEVGGFDTRFGIGTFEDNDLCYRLRRAGYRLVISARSFVHHEGSKSLRGANLEIEKLLAENQTIFQRKWRDDIESGFASHLSGFERRPIVFDQSKNPAIRVARASSVATRPEISLCMIVRDEEKTIGDCLESVRPFVVEMLVMDTGSVDKTVEIARAKGAFVKTMEWPDSFPAARNEAMQGAKGKWILWVDADDTMPFECGERIVEAVASAPEDVMGFVVPVRFLEDCGGGTVVDHVKIFRNVEGLTWEGRIHEQILSSLRQFFPKGTLARVDAFVLHSGYDTSQAGQAKKRRRDSKLLQLDLAERPGHPFVLFNLGMTAHYAGDHEEAIDWFQKSIAASSDSESHIRKAYALMVGSLKSLGKNDEAMAKCAAGLAKVEGDPELLFLSAGLHAALGEHQKAIELYHSSIKGDTNGAFTSVDPGIRGWKALHNVALSHLALNEWDSAKSAWLAAMNSEGRLEAAEALFTAALNANDYKVAKEALTWVEAHQGKCGLWPGMVEPLCVSAGVDPAPILDVELGANGRNLEARRRLANHYLQTGREQFAVPHLDLLQSWGIAEGAELLSRLAANQGEPQKAAAWHQRAIELGGMEV